MKKRVISILLCAAMVIGLLSGCGSKDSGDSTPSGGKTEDGEYENFITVDVFSSVANYQGLQTGWFAKAVKDRFNMELNIISPNVSGGGDTLYQTRVASGDLGDLIIIGAEEGRLQEVVKANVVMDISDYIADKDYLMQYQDAIEYINHENEATAVDEEGIYAIPTEVSSNSPTEVTGTELNFGSYVRWDLYAELGYPEMETLEDLLDVLEAMQELYPETEDGQKVYALSLFKDWDDTHMMVAKQPACFYGYMDMGFIFSRADGTDDQSIIESDSMYVRMLKFYYEANQRGLVDPESTTQTYDTLYNKYVNGQVLFSFWPWLGQAAFNTTENMEAGKGFMLAPINDLQIYAEGPETYGSKTILAIGSKAEDPERLAEFIDWMYSPEGICMQTSPSRAACGPEGLTWEMVNGEPVLTDFGKQALIDGDAEVPEEWGGGDYIDGASALNITTVNWDDINPESGDTYAYTNWDSYQRENTNPLYDDWKEVMGASTTVEYLVEHDMVVVAAGAGYVQPEEDSQINVLRGQIKEGIVSSSWQMVFAPSESEFESILEAMQSTAYGLGYDEVLAVDQKNCDDQNAARKAAIDRESK